MVATTERSPSFREIALSVVLVTAAVCLVAGVLVAGRFVLTGIDDGSASGGEYALGFVFGLILYGPALIWAAWPVTFPAIVVLGVALAFAGRRIRFENSRWAGNRAVRTGKVILLAYAAVLVVSWLVWLFGGQ